MDWVTASRISVALQRGRRGTRRPTWWWKKLNRATFPWTIVPSATDPELEPGSLCYHSKPGPSKLWNNRDTGLRSEEGAEGRILHVLTQSSVSLPWHCWLLSLGCSLGRVFLIECHPSWLEHLDGRKNITGSWRTQFCIKLLWDCQSLLSPLTPPSTSPFAWNCSPALVHYPTQLYPQISFLNFIPVILA